MTDKPRSPAGRQSASAAFLASRPYRQLAGPTFPGDGRDIGCSEAELAAFVQRDIRGFKRLASAFWKSMSADSPDGPAWLRQWLARQSTASGELRFRVLAVGYGDGRLDLPLLLALDQLLCKHVSSWATKGHLDVVALEPNWISGSDSTPRQNYGSDAQRWAGMFGIKLEDRSAHADADSPGRVRVRVRKVTCEAWLRQQQQTAKTERFDMAQAFFVLHLLSDWKDSVASLIDRHLHGGGLFLTANASADLACVEAPDSATLHANRRHPSVWQQLWKSVHQVRGELLLPRFRHVSTTSHGLLADALAGCGFSAKGTSSAAQLTWTRYVPWKTVEDIFQATAEGRKAKTLSTLKISDGKLARRFAESVLSLAREMRGAQRSRRTQESAESSRPRCVPYRIGLSLYAYQAPASPRPDLHSRFLRAVGTLAVRRSAPIVTQAFQRLHSAAITAQTPAAIRATEHAVQRAMNEEISQVLCLSRRADLLDIQSCSDADLLAYSRRGDNSQAMQVRLAGIIESLVRKNA